MSDTTVVLGSVTFTGLEVPQSIPVGGEQHLSVHELVGGSRVVDAMGRADRAIEWSGWLIGPNAVAREQALDALRISGSQQTLSWGGYRYSVIVRSFTAEYQRFYQIPYRISCEVIADLTQPVSTPSSPPIDQQVNADMILAALIADAIADQVLIAAIQAAQVSLALISSFATSPPSAIAALAQTVLTAQTQVGVLTAGVNAQIGTPSSFGGVVGPSSGPALIAQTSQIFQLNNLNNISGVLGRVSLNLASVRGSPNSIAVAGGNLYRIAEQQYGDATAWTAIAKANGLTDPFVQGVSTLIIPPQSDQSAGILLR